MTFESTPPNEEAPPPTQKERLPHSRYGIISCSLMLFFFVVSYVYNLICAIIFQDIGDGLVAFHIGEFVYLLAMIAAFCYAIAGLRQPRTRKFFAVLGLVFSTPQVIFLLGIVLLYCLFLTGIVRIV